MADPIVSTDSQRISARTIGEVLRGEQLKIVREKTTSPYGHTTNKHYIEIDARQYGQLADTD